MLDVIVKPDPSTSLGMTVKNRQFFLAFYDKAGYNFISRSGTNNFDAYEIATTDYTDLRGFISFDRNYGFGL